MINNYKIKKREKNDGEQLSECENNFFTELLSKPLEIEVFEEIKDVTVKIPKVFLLIHLENFRNSFARKETSNMINFKN